MHRLLLCCSINLGVVFDPRSHRRYPPYKLMSRNWYTSSCGPGFGRKEIYTDQFPMNREIQFLCLDSSQAFKESTAIQVPDPSKIMHFQSPPTSHLDTKFLLSAKFRIRHVWHFPKSHSFHLSSVHVPMACLYDMMLYPMPCIQTHNIQVNYGHQHFVPLVPLVYRIEARILVIRLFISLNQDLPIRFNLQELI
jgi:hypothetical protein